MNITTKVDAFKQANVNEEVEAKVIRKAWIARQLLQKGGEKVRIIDVKPDRLDPNRSVYVFRNDSSFQEILSSVLEENRKNREEHDKSEAQKQIDELNKQVEELKKMLENKDKE